MSRIPSYTNAVEIRDYTGLSKPLNTRLKLVYISIDGALKWPPDYLKDGLFKNWRRQ
tara:strand:- start:317 stop:487 length:171 start_codon:yes stop_codon:yes gene_type:complete